MEGVLKCVTYSKENHKTLRIWKNVLCVKYPHKNKPQILNKQIHFNKPEILVVVCDGVGGDKVCVCVYVCVCVINNSETCASLMLEQQFSCGVSPTYVWKTAERVKYFTCS